MKRASLVTCTLKVDKKILFFNFALFLHVFFPKTIAIKSINQELLKRKFDNLFHKVSLHPPTVFKIWGWGDSGDKILETFRNRNRRFFSRAFRINLGNLQQSEFFDQTGELKIISILWSKKNVVVILQ